MAPRFLTPPGAVSLGVERALLRDARPTADKEIHPAEGPFLGVRRKPCEVPYGQVAGGEPGEVVKISVGTTCDVPCSQVG